VSWFPAKAPLPAGAVNVTIAPCTALPKESRTVASSGLVNAVLIGWDCGVPPVAVIEKGGPAVLVRLNEVAPVTPFTLAFTA